jgi:hypothetical protein
MRKGTAALLVLGLLVLGCKQEQEWQLPVHMGDSKARVYETLGEPSQVVDSPPNEINWFKNSGLSITFGPNRNVTGITIHGVWNKRRFQTYQEPVLSELRVTDKIVAFLTKLGRPVQRKLTWHECEESFVWQRAQFLIEVTFWTKEMEIGVPRRLVHVGEVSRIDISRAPGSNR